MPDSNLRVRLHDSRDVHTTRTSLGNRIVTGCGRAVSWAVRRDSPYGSQINDMPDEAEARAWATSETNREHRFSSTLVRRAVGPWTEVRDA